MYYNVSITAEYEKKFKKQRDTVQGSFNFLNKCDKCHVQTK